MVTRDDEDVILSQPALRDEIVLDERFDLPVEVRALSIVEANRVPNLGVRTPFAVLLTDAPGDVVRLAPT